MTDADTGTSMSTTTAPAGVRNALVTGGRGFIAQHVVQRLAAAGTNVTVLDLPAEVDSSNTQPNVHYLGGDIRDRWFTDSAATTEIDTIFHFAAIVGVETYMLDPGLVQDVNITGTRNILALASKTGARVVFGSTSEVYGKNPSVPWTESSDSVLGPTSHTRWCYSASKIIAEHLIHQACEQSGVDARILRFFNVYGPHQRPDFVISRSIHRALRGEPIEIHNGGEQTRCFTFIDDVVQAILIAGSRELVPGLTLNIGSSDEISMKEALILLHELFNDEAVKLSFVDRNRSNAQYEDVPRRVPSVDQAERILGWTATTKLRDGLAKTLQWARESPWWWRKGMDPVE